MFHCLWIVAQSINWMLVIASGQSIGKKVARTQIRRVDGKVAGALHGVVLREFPYMALGWILPLSQLLVGFDHLRDQTIGLLIAVVAMIDCSMIFGAAHRCAHDYIAGTRVVSIRT